MKVDQVLKKQIKIIKPDKETFDEINQISKDFVKFLKEKLKIKKINAEVFIGGSLAKGTLVKKNKYDVDIFVRFNKKYDNRKLSKLLGLILGNKVKKVHGSRDYFQIPIKKIIMEVVPVLKIKKQKEAQNITDLSYFHVSYINKKRKKNKKVTDEIILAKTFAHANNCYGAESYIHGFSGYALELLICHYKSFKNFLGGIININPNNNKLVLDPEKLYKSKKQILEELNSSKKQGPIILIDPTFKERNALAGLSNETFIKFQKIAKQFLKSPKPSFFEKKVIGHELVKKYKDTIRIIEIKTTKQAGDISGTKSKKFLGFFKRQLEKEFKVKLGEFDYDEKKNLAYFFVITDKKKDEIIRGPPINAKKNLARFKKSRKGFFIKRGIVYAKVKHNLSFENFIKNFKEKDKKIIKEMNIKRIKIIK